MAHISLINTPDFSLEKRQSKTPMSYMHCHNSLELFYVLNGEREYFVGDQFFTLSEGDLIMIPNDTLHRTAKKAATCILVNFTLSYLEKYFTHETIKSLRLKKPFVFRPNPLQKELLRKLCTALYREYTRLDKDIFYKDFALLGGYLYQILFTISFEKNEYFQEQYNKTHINSIVKYINENYSTISSIDEISKRFYISKYHLCRLFAQNLGISLIEYLNTVKIKAACKLLKENNKRITDIALECGFNSSSYFCKVFKSEIGMSPSEYKKQN